MGVNTAKDKTAAVAESADHQLMPQKVEVNNALQDNIFEQTTGMTLPVLDTTSQRNNMDSVNGMRTAGVEWNLEDLEVKNTFLTIPDKKEVNRRIKSAPADTADSSSEGDNMDMNSVKDTIAAVAESADHQLMPQKVKVNNALIVTNNKDESKKIMSAPEKRTEGAKLQHDTCDQATGMLMPQKVEVRKTFISVTNTKPEERRIRSDPAKYHVSLANQLNQLLDEQTLNALATQFETMQRQSIHREGSRITWTVDAMKWQSSEKHVVSPSFELTFMPSLEQKKFKMMITFPQKEKKNKKTGPDQKSKKKEKHPIEGILELKCQDDVEDGLGRMEFIAEIGGGLERCQITHDFAVRAVWTNQKKWSFQQVLNEESMTFDVCLNVH